MSENARFYSDIKQDRTSRLLCDCNCNPSWTETRRALLPELPLQNTPELAVRLSMMKRHTMMSCVIQDKLHSPVASYVHVLEFQKRGLLHAYCIFFFEPASKLQLKRLKTVDELASAKPLSERDQELRELVLESSNHTPCSPLNI